MSTKHIFLGFSVLVAAGMIIVSCNKKPTNEAPTSDSETKSAVEASWATLVITDIDQACAYAGENYFFPATYSGVPNGFDPVTKQGTITITRDTTAATTKGNHISISWNKTNCMDGHKRDGSIFMNFQYDDLKNYPQSQLTIDALKSFSVDPHANYYHSWGFVCEVSLTDYYVDGWKIDTYWSDSTDVLKKSRAVIWGVNGEKDDPRSIPLSWYISGKFVLSDTANHKSIVWDGTIKKTLANSTYTTIWAATTVNKNKYITWAPTSTNVIQPILNYEGVATGTTTDSNPFKFETTAGYPLVRDFGCFPSSVLSVSLDPKKNNQIVPTVNQFHPFKQGIASFTVTDKATKTDKYPRQIYYGNEDTPLVPVQCDNSGVVLIKGNAYRVDFWR